MLDLLDFVAGETDGAARPDAVLEVRSPADTNDVIARFGVAKSQADRAVEAARAALRAWRRTPRDARAAVLLAYRDRIRANADELATAIAREIGKPMWEARTEVGAMATKVDLTLGEGARFVRDEVLADLPGEIRHRPHGVMAVIGPFNFPGHLPNGHFVPALFTGNTVVFKPSEKAPRTAALVARCMHEAGIPSGVFNVVQGDAAVAEHLVVHPGVDGVLFTGSIAVGKRILAMTADTPGKLVALELGGKNASIVLGDADVERAAREIAFSGFATAGQRCTATSRVFAERSVAARLAERIAELARGAVIGHHADPRVFAGPMIGEAPRAALLAAQQTARAAGWEPLAPGGVVDVADKPGFYVQPAVHFAPDGAGVVRGYTDHELFGPDVAVRAVDDDDEAVARGNDGPFGLAAAVYTASRQRFEAIADELRVGVVHWNRSSAGASSRLPFGGIKDSGNHRPAGITASAQCVYPLAVFLAPSDDSPLPTWNGLV